MTKLIGIDPGIMTTGIAVYDPAGSQLELFTGDLQKAMSFLARNTASDYIVIMEDPNCDSAVFGMWQQFQKLGRDASALARVLKQAQSVGMNKAAAQLLGLVMSRAGYRIARIAPSNRHRADTKNTPVELLRFPTKTTKEQFKKLTGFDGQSSEHSRDAATLVWGRSLKWAETMSKA